MSLRLAAMKRALEDVQRVKDPRHDETVQKAYGALCHQLPILVLTNGLALTAAFIDSKAVGEGTKAEPFKLMRRHLIGVLDGVANDRTMSSLLNQRGRNPDQYMLDTFTILDSWTFYKRFAESILNVKPGEGSNPLEESVTDG